MTNFLYILRFFRIVPPVPPLMSGAFAVVTLVGAVVIALEPSQSAAVVTPILVLQVFSASAGFAGPARRGYFDLLLTRGESRVRIALVQWATAIAPGVVSWGVVAAVEMMLAGVEDSAALATGTLTAMVAVSTIPWGLTVGLPRFSAAIGWLLVVCVARVFAGYGWPDGIRHLVFPPGLIGRDVAAEPFSVVPLLVMTVCSMTAALFWIDRADLPLESAQ